MQPKIQIVDVKIVPDTYSGMVERWPDGVYKQQGGSNIIVRDRQRDVQHWLLEGSPHDWWQPVDKVVSQYAKVAATVTYSYGTEVISYGR